VLAVDQLDHLAWEGKAHCQNVWVGWRRAIRRTPASEIRSSLQGEPGRARMAGVQRARSVVAMCACAACGKTLGIYERLVWVRPEDAPVEGSLISLREHREFQPSAARLLHADCAAPRDDR
jgi:hypothetical protein